MLCAGCTSAPPAPLPVTVYNRCPQVSLCPMPASNPQTNGDLSADIRRLERALEQCALQVETVKHCQDEINAKTQYAAQSPDGRRPGPAR
ncbi:Rz1-like lysis system protein LysC [Kosakonia sp. ML.JS2a]|uniref:Rz1-like lysis system protein LysC n=1 Tax=Kosakonia sp. ML.JS2a TaxID=2980557 RepID=UPI0021D8B6E2|nr:Rz1-like lysis system protein LysC [Kosakonia sp. ML.JS2a]UXY12118.1 Rz1-like lysis system protein LysC [Kosakonia sp. ML.JS2a]